MENRFVKHTLRSIGRRLSKYSFFKTVGRFDGMKQESLVLQKTGWSISRYIRMVKTEQTVTYSKNGHAVTVLTFSSISFQCQSGCGMDNSVW